MQIIIHYHLTTCGRYKLKGTMAVLEGTMSQYMYKFNTSGVEDINLAAQFGFQIVECHKDSAHCTTSGDARKDYGNYEPDVENDEEDDVKDDHT